MPKELIGIKVLKALAKKETAVVLEVAAVALAALLKENAILLLMSFLIYGISPLNRYPSTKTKISSAAIPRTMKIAKVCKVEKNVTLNTP